MKRELRSVAIGLASITAVAVPAAAQGPAPGEPAPGDVTALAKATQNPVADLLAIPLQFNFNSGGDLGDRTALNLNVQPVVPISLTSEWIVVARTIIPLYNLPDQSGDGASGVGDIVSELLVSSAEASTFQWGVGPVFSLPTATLAPVRTGSWAAGPAAVGLVTTGRWVAGALATQTWTFADYGDRREVEQLQIQAFANFNFGQGWAVVAAPLIIADWTASSDNAWTVPLGGGLTWTTHVGDQAVQLSAQYYRNLVYPDGGAANQLRFLVSFLFPARPRPVPCAR